MLHPPVKSDRIGLGFLQYYAPQRAYHPGVDFNFGKPSDDLGFPVHSPTDAIVEYISVAPTRQNNMNGGLGLYVVLRHDNLEVWTRYMHLLKTAPNLAAGQRLSRGFNFAFLGASGTSSPHLHMEVLNATGLAFIRDFQRPYGRYVSGLTKDQVASMFIDPVKWLAESTDELPWEAPIREWAVNNGVIETGWDHPEQPMSQVRIAAALKKMYERLKGV